MWDYTDKVKEYYLHPRNVGELETPDATGEAGSLACGDALKLTLKINEDDIITDAKFKTFGCGSAIATSSVLTEMIIGKTIDEALRITNQDIAGFLGGLPREKMHCSVMAKEALEAAINEYRGVSVEHREKEEGELICECFGVFEGKIRKAIRDNELSTVDEVTYYTKAGGGCGSCKEKIQKILDDECGIFQVKRKDDEGREYGKKATKKMTNLQMIKLIEETIDREIRPALQKDDGDIELIDIVGDEVRVALRGACAGCISADFTLTNYVEAKLHEFVDDNLVVIEVSDGEEVCEND